MDGITASMEMSLSKFRETEKDSEAWCAAVHGAAESDMSLQLKKHCFLLPIKESFGEKRYSVILVSFHSRFISSFLYWYSRLLENKLDELNG